MSESEDIRNRLDLMTLQERQEFLRELEKQQNLRDIAVNDKLKRLARDKWAKGENLDVESLKILASRRGLGVKSLEDHPFFETHLAIENITRAFEILSRSRNDLIQILGRHHVSVRYDGFRGSEKIQSDATATVFQFSFAAFSLVGMYRRLFSVQPDAKPHFDPLVEKCFPDIELKAFVKDMRNNYGHVKILNVEPTGSISFGDKKEVISDFHFLSSDLLVHERDWNSKSISFIKRHERIDIMELIGKYFNSAEMLHRKYLNATGIGYSGSALEFNRLRHIVNSVPKLQWLQILGRQAIAGGHDPYDHLHHYFSTAEIDRINCLPRNSMEQIEYMITVIDPLGLRDEHLLSLVYTLFQVKS